MTSVRIRKLRTEICKKYNIDGYVIPKNDEYHGEYSYPEQLEVYIQFRLDQQD